MPENVESVGVYVYEGLNKGTHLLALDPFQRGRASTEVIVLLSGGIDSAACLFLSKRKGYMNRALTIRFHGMAKGELWAARRWAPLRESRTTGSSLIGPS